MADLLARYKAFIDELVRRASSVEARRMRERLLYELPSEAEREKDRRRGDTEALALYERLAQYNTFLESLSDDQRQVIASLLDSEKQAGMAEVLAVLTDGEYILSREDEALPFEPFYTSSYYDFDARIAGESWPDEKTE